MDSRDQEILDALKEGKSDEEVMNDFDCDQDKVNQMRGQIENDKEAPAEDAPEAPAEEAPAEETLTGQAPPEGEGNDEAPAEGENAEGEGEEAPEEEKENE